MMEFFLKALLQEGINAVCGVPLKELTTFRIGGPCAVLVQPRTEREIIKTLALCGKFDVKYNVIGNGSNVLAADDGFNGVVIKLGKRFSAVKRDGSRIFAQSGATLKSVFNMALANGLGGAEFMAAIPASVGGAVFMNAGCYGREIKDVLTSVRVADKEGCRILSVEEANLGYRTSDFSNNGLIITGAEFEFYPSEKGAIETAAREIVEKKRETQPLDKPSAGSVFKKPSGDSAGRLIEQCGLKGARVGGAQVSLKHAGFIINADNARCKDVLSLIGIIKRQVKAKFGVELQLELRLLGDTDDSW